jgi:hypothetical protein
MTRKKMHAMKTGWIAAMIFLAGLMAGGVQAQVLNEAIKLVSPASTGLTEKDAADGIREALIKGTNESVALVTKPDGYFGNPEIKIPFPQQARDIESKLRSVGMGSQVDEAVLAINRAAEDAGKSAAPIFVAAVKKMSISDAVQVVRGGNDAATRYLEKSTSAELRTAFKPVIQASLDRVNATKYWADLVKTYNQIPFVTKQNPDLAAYATDMAIKGLFVMIAKEELKIRQNPAARTTELLKKVFGK